MPIRSVFRLDILETRSGFAVLRVTGKDALKIFSGEAGGHRWQRIPPTEKKGRVHTSTITVAVLPIPQEQSINLDPKDIEESFTCGSGPGGQHRNRTATAVMLKHLPSGIIVRAENNKSQRANREAAMSALKARLLANKEAEYNSARSSTRKQQIGSGMRGDKVRTIQVRNDRVVNHVNCRSISYKDYARGKIMGLIC